MATDYYFPKPRGRNGRGGSHTEPVPIGPEHPYNEIRLFPYRINAERALAAWCKGTWDTYRDSGDYWDGIEPEEETTVHKVSWRRIEDYENVEVTVTIPRSIQVGAKPIRELYGATLIGNGALFGYRSAEDEDKANLNIPISEQPKAIKASRIVRRLGTNIFETQNSIYTIVLTLGGHHRERNVLETGLVFFGCDLPGSDKPLE